MFKSEFLMEYVDGYESCGTGYAFQYYETQLFL